MVPNLLAGVWIPASAVQTSSGGSTRTQIPEGGLATAALSRDRQRSQCQLQHDLWPHWLTVRASAASPRVRSKVHTGQQLERILVMNGRIQGATSARW
jgi:hypothetical protein